MKALGPKLFIKFPNRSLGFALVLVGCGRSASRVGTASHRRNLSGSFVVEPRQASDKWDPYARSSGSSLGYGRLESPFRSLEPWQSLLALVGVCEDPMWQGFEDPVLDGSGLGVSQSFYDAIWTPYYQDLLQKEFVRAVKQRSHSRWKRVDHVRNSPKPKDHGITHC